MNYIHYHRDVKPVQSRSSAITGRCGLCCLCRMNKSQKKLSATYPLLIFQVLFRTGGVKRMLQCCSFILWVQWSKGCPLGITQYCAARERKSQMVYIHFETNPAVAVFVLKGHTVAGTIPVFISSTWIKWSHHLNWVLAAPVSVTWGTLWNWCWHSTKPGGSWCMEWERGRERIL